MNSLATYKPACNDLLGDFETAREIEHKMQMRKEIQSEILRLDEIEFQKHERICPICKGVLYSHGKTSKQNFLATCGQISVCLHRLRCVQCRHITVPGQALIPDGGISATLAERICDLASKMPYKKACESMFIQHAIKTSPKKFWSIVQLEAALIDDVLAGEAKALYKEGIVPTSVDLKGEKPLIIGIDGGHLKGWSKNAGFEVKCATVATGSAPGPGAQRHLKDRVGYATNCSLDDFRRRVSVLAIKCGYLSAKIKIFVSDGAAWISKMIQDYFPEAIHILDMYHLKNKVRTLYGISATGILADFRDAALKACNKFDPDLLVSIIENYGPKDDSKLEQIQDLISYIKNNASAIKNHKLVSIHGSGWIEKGVDLMVSRRMKNRGMSWTIPGSSHIIPFAVLRYNNEWDVYWNTRKGLSQPMAC